MVGRVDHIGIAVEDLDDAVALYEAITGTPVESIEDVADQKVRTAFFAVGESHLELLFPTSPDSPVAKFLSKRGPGIHHICLEVDSIEAKLRELKAAGFQLIDETPRVGAHGARIAFVHPKSTSGVLIELSEKGPRTKVT